MLQRFAESSNSGLVLRYSQSGQIPHIADPLADPFQYKELPGRIIAKYSTLNMMSADHLDIKRPKQTLSNGP